jgi:hypothetical protein
MNGYKRVVCVKIGDFKHHRKLVIGKAYKCEFDSNNYYIIGSDGRALGYYPFELFLDEDEWIATNRDNKLNELGI